MQSKLLNIHIFIIGLLLLTALFFIPLLSYSQQSDKQFPASGSTFGRHNHQYFLLDKDGTNFAEFTFAEVSSGIRYGIKVNDDTTGNGENRISRIIYNLRGDLITVEVELAEPNQRITIVVYNLLGKAVLEPHSYDQNSVKAQYDLNVSGLPNGVYLCTVTGRNFRLREKIMISR